MAQRIRIMKDYPTPRTNAAANDSIVKVYETSKQLERELAECREALGLVLRRGGAIQNSDQYLFEVLRVCRETLTNTAPNP